VALDFLVPVAWAAVIGIAEWPLYRRALARFPNRSMALAVTFAATTALFVIGPLSLAAVTLAQESQAAIQSVQQTGLAMPAWLPALPLVGGRAATYWQQHIGNPQAANALLSTLSAGSILGWTRSVGGEVARESALFLITLLALVTLLARGRDYQWHA
jgi:predicted PurR-regulated permease PerM